jgi:DNA-binding transcriptional ArsR family regulator
MPPTWKFKTFAGFDMPEMMRPRPKIRPIANWTRTATASTPVPHQEDGRYAGRHEGGGRDQRAHREPQQAADAVAGGAATAPNRTETREQSAGNQDRRSSLDRLRRQASGDKPHQHGCGDETDDEGKPTGKFAVLAGGNSRAAIPLTPAIRPVGELADIAGLSSAALSLHLGKMRALSLVKPRRDGQTIYYSIASPEVRSVLETLYRLFCAPWGIASVHAGSAA